MRFKLDENLPGAAKPLLNQHGHDALSVIDEHLVGRADEVVLGAARSEGRMLVTFDLDLPTSARIRRGATPGSWCRVSDHRTAAWSLWCSGKSSQRKTVEAFAGALVVVTDATVRVRRA